jgi:RNA polymerase sigma-70 factor (ECF subfamily)
VSFGRGHSRPAAWLADRTGDVYSESCEVETLRSRSRRRFDPIPLFRRTALLTQTRQPLSISESTAERYTLADPDVRLMLQVRDDDAQAFEELMLRYQHRLLSLLTHHVGQRDLAEDLTQDVFLRVYRARKRYTPGAKFSTWLFTIAGNVASNALRTLARRREVKLAPRSDESGANTLEAAALAASGLMPTRQLDKAELCAAVQQAMGVLNDRQRMAVLLAKFEHFSYAEIGEVMDLSPQAIKSLLSRARCNLREALQPYLDRGAKVNGAAAASAADSNYPTPKANP